MTGGSFISPEPRLVVISRIPPAQVREGGDRMDADDSEGYRPGHSRLRLKNGSTQPRKGQIYAHLPVSPIVSNLWMNS
jgi:hypothetical protein